MGGLGISVVVVIDITHIVARIGVSVGGANRWINAFGFQFQPVEVMKFWWVIAVAVVLERKPPI